MSAAAVSPCPDDLVRLVDPGSGLPLRRDRPWSLTDGRSRWPVAAGIPYLRAGRDALAADALAALDAGDEHRALALLLADQDDYARTPPPDTLSLAELVGDVEAGRATLRHAMTALHFGPVADYFAYRWSSPTYLSGLALLERFAGTNAAGPVVEVACGIGHYLRDLADRGRCCAGVDVVFSKLWLARRFVVPDCVPLVCGDAVAGLPIGPISGGAVAFCHDAFYFLPEKPRVLDALRRAIGDSGRVLIGHAHNRDFDHGGVAGEPRTPAEYAALLPGARLFDDAELAASVISGDPAPARSPAELARVEAVALVDAPGEGPGLGLLDPVPSTPLRLNPLLADEAGMLVPRWPSDRYRAEYEAASGYLAGEPTPSPDTLAAASTGVVGRGADPAVDRLARRRILLDLPERW